MREKFICTLTWIKQHNSAKQKHGRTEVISDRSSGVAGTVTNMHYLGSFVPQDMLLSLYIFAFDEQNMKNSESMLAFYIVACPAV